MRTDIIRAAVTAVGIAVAGLGLSGTAHADGMTEAYVTVLHNEGIFALQGGDATLYAWGSWVCTEMRDGAGLYAHADRQYGLHPGLAGDDPYERLR